MFFFQTFMTIFVLTKSSGPKSHAVAFTALILPVFVCVTQVSQGGRLLIPIRVGRGKIYPPQPMTHTPPPAICAVLHTYQGGQRQDLPSGQSKHLRQIRRAEVTYI